MTKTLSISLVALGASLLPALSFGLGLGDIQIESRLNQPLRARIEIVDVSDEEWRQIRARIAAPGVLSEAAAYPEILQSITLSARADASRGHFIEVKSAEPLTEPLFDLPVEVAGGAVQVVRNYSVLLDPAATEDAPRSLPATAALAKADTDAPSRNAGAGGDVASGQDAGRKQKVTAAAVVDAQARVAPHRTSHRSSRGAHSSAVRKMATRAPAAGAANTSGTAQAANASNAAAASGAGAPGTAEQQQLQGQLAALQDTLTRMQTTIAAQDAEIAKLTAQIAGRSPPQPDQRASTPRVEYLPASHPEVADEDASSARPSWFHRWRMMFYWAAGVGVGLVLLVLGAAAVVRRRNARVLRDAAWKEAPKKPAASQEPRSDPLAWQSTLREAQSGRWPKPAPAELSLSMSDARPAPRPAPERADAAATTVAATVAFEDLTQDLETDLEALSASYESERMESETSSPGIDAWRAQNEMLARDYLAETGLNEPVTETPEMLQRTLRDGKHDTDSDFVAEVAI